jgi:hypothetical protein
VSAILSGCSEQPLPGSEILISLRGIGHPPSFKNKKMLTRGKLITDPKKQQWMRAVKHSIESQLLSVFATKGIATGTAHTQPCKIASLVPLDDCLQWIPSHSVHTLWVSKGDEGADILIERIL